MGITYHYFFTLISDIRLGKMVEQQFSGSLGLKSIQYLQNLPIIDCMWGIRSSNGYAGAVVSKLYAVLIYFSYCVLMNDSLHSDASILEN